MDEIIAKDEQVIYKGKDTASDSDILVYGTADKADWAAYMTKETKQGRSDWVRGLNFGGTTDWAVDLEEFVSAPPDEPDEDPNDKCTDDVLTYDKNADMGEGEFMEWFLMNPEFAATTGEQYVTIVNLTPHRFKLRSTHSYQMDTFNWGDIPQGKARQNKIEYGGGVGANPVDTNGEAYYDIEGTSLRFEVRCTTHIPDTYPRRIILDLSDMGLGQREYKVPDQKVPVTLIITGSESYGFIANLRHGHGAWQAPLYDVIKDRRVDHTVFPGTHDSGMSKITNRVGFILATILFSNIPPNPSTAPWVNAQI